MFLLLDAFAASYRLPPKVATYYLNRIRTNWKHFSFWRSLRVDLFSVYVKREVVIALLCNSTVCLIFMAQMWYYTRF
jgi:hypothetical protein